MIVADLIAQSENIVKIKVNAFITFSFKTFWGIFLFVAVNAFFQKKEILFVFCRNWHYRYTKN